MPIEFKRSWNNEEVESFRDSWVRFVETEMLPQDAEARRRGHVGHALWRRAGELGFLCVDIPEEWGGAGGDFRHEAVLHEEMARRALSGMSIGVHSIAAHYLLNHGTEDQKRRYLPRLAKGELIGAIAMTEPGAGSDLQAIRTRAQRHGNQYAINGSKTFISNGFLAGVVVVVCKTDPSERARGIANLLNRFAVGRRHYRHRTVAFECPRIQESARRHGDSRCTGGGEMTFTKVEANQHICIIGTPLTPSPASAAARNIPRSSQHRGGA